ncbi:transglycosylase SLT domain-containing protein [Nocardia sp. NPDC005978]|uniref:aggregation-promoting factor C-terminal-like domain-containing protein n=1 Tax=unclassified Nocardia TaxID=2637762 RepID=UPI0033B68644
MDTAVSSKSPRSHRRSIRTITFMTLLAAAVPLATAQGTAAPDPVAAPGLIDQGAELLPKAASTLPRIVNTASLASTMALKGLALSIVPLNQFWAFDQIITMESSWQIFAVNPSSGAYGLPQALPADKMATEGPDWLFNPLTQLRWAYRYMNSRYGSPAAAWEFWQANHWY